MRKSVQLVLGGRACQSAPRDTRSAFDDRKPALETRARAPAHPTSEPQAALRGDPAIVPSERGSHR